MKIKRPESVLFLTLLIKIINKKKTKIITFSNSKIYSISHFKRKTKENKKDKCSNGANRAHQISPFHFISIEEQLIKNKNLHQQKNVYSFFSILFKK